MAGCRILTESLNPITTESGVYIIQDGCTPVPDGPATFVWHDVIPINSAENYWKAYRTKNRRPWLKR